MTGTLTARRQREWSAVRVPVHWSAAVVVMCLVGVFWPSVQAVARTWLQFGEFYGHGLLVLTMTGMLIWRDRHRIFETAEPGSWPLLVVAAGFSGLWALGYLAEVQSVQLIAAPVAIVASLGALVGIAGSLILAAHSSLILLALPIWGGASAILQSVATAVVERLLLLLNVRAYVEGNVINIAGGTIEVASGCSGIGFILVSVTLGLYVALRYRTNWRTSLSVVATSFAFGMLVNWARIALIVAVADHAGMDYPLVHDHRWFGWVVFAVLALPLIWFGFRKLGLQEVDAEVRAVQVSRVSLGFLATLLVATTIPGAYARAALQFPVPDDQALRLALSNAWIQQDTPSPLFSDEVRYGSDRWVEAILRSAEGDADVQALVASYDGRRPGQGPDVTSLTVAAEEWSRVGSGTWQVPASAASIPVTTYRLANASGSSYCMAVWYRIGNATAGTRWSAKLRLIQERVLGRYDVAVFSVAARDENCPSDRLTAPVAELLDMAGSN